MSKNILRRGLKIIVVSSILVISVVGLVIYFVAVKPSPKIGKVLDEAKQAGRSVASFPAADEDYFREMDHGVALSRDEVQGRNNWLVWTAGNDAFWNFMAGHTFGSFDLLKIVAPHPDYAYGRDNRWAYQGLVNEPCFSKSATPDQHGLYLDKREEGPDCPPDPFANAEKYPGVKVGARGTATAELGSFYGKPSGIVGLRLFSNPDFDEKAAKNWDSVRFYKDPDYYNKPELVRPYRVGMSCGFCHVSPNPINPPTDPENPRWENLSSNPGAQYFWVDRIFFWDNQPPSYTVNEASYGTDYGVETSAHAKSAAVGKSERNFIFQLFHTNPPGALDTSLVSTDYINNPRTMNAVYNLGARIGPAKRWGLSKLSGGELNNDQFGNHAETQALGDLYQEPYVKAAHILKDGADSVGVLGALNRVYINIGLFSEEWVQHFRPVVGGKEISPIEISVLDKNSVYWKVTESQSPKVALFFLNSAQPDKLSQAIEKSPELQQHLKPMGQLGQGQKVFAENCAHCHSSKFPDPQYIDPPGYPEGLNCEGGGNGAQYLQCWDSFWQWTQTAEFKAAMLKRVKEPDFLQDNFLSTERRIPSSLLGTNLCSPLATNAIAGDIWDNFSSTSYKELPSVGNIMIQNPLNDAFYDYPMPAGGRGYTRVASLVSLWSTAPYLQNNSVGEFHYLPTVEARLASFNDSIEKMLWPEKRLNDEQLVTEHLGLPRGAAMRGAEGYAYRTTASSCLKVPYAYLPRPIRPVVRTKLASWLFGWALDAEDETISLGPIPKGTPVGLISNTRLVPETDNLSERLKHWWNLLRTVGATSKALKKTGVGCTEPELAALDAQPEKVMQLLQTYKKHDVGERLLSMSKCPDFIVNRGHTFGAELSDADKRELIEYLKHF